MVMKKSLNGVYAAAVTPLNPAYEPDLEAIPALLSFLANRGCHGALLLGTTGEGPSFSYPERIEIFRAAALVRQEHAQFSLLAGTGSPSLEDTISMTRAAFDQGFDGVVVLPPYYYRKVSDEGLFRWFSLVLKKAMPGDGALLGYHFPSITGVPLSIELITRLKEAFPDRFVGLKDSSGDAEFARLLGERFGTDLRIFTGNDRLFQGALDHQAAGCITAMANVGSPLLRQGWENHQAGVTDDTLQKRLSDLRGLMEIFSPAPPFLKSLLRHRYHFPEWTVRPPLTPLNAEAAASVLASYDLVLR